MAAAEALEPLFCLSPGRSGSTTLAHTLSQAPDCDCRHEPHPQLIAEATSWRYRRTSGGRIATVLRASRQPQPPARVYGETSHKMALIVPLIRRAFPSARFVWLTRDGRDFVRSAYRLGWYEDGEPDSEWARWRPRGDLAGEVPRERWLRTDRFERVCWHWSYVNRVIEADLATTGVAESPRPARRAWIRVRLERLESELPRICEYAGIAPFEFKVERENERWPAYAAGRPLAELDEWPRWTPARHEAFERHCGALMDRLYPRWRAAVSSGSR